jgi:hypothetical protein
MSEPFRTLTCEPIARIGRHSGRSNGTTLDIRVVLITKTAVNVDNDSRSGGAMSDSDSDSVWLRQSTQPIVSTTTSAAVTQDCRTTAPHIEDADSSISVCNRGENSRPDCHTSLPHIPATQTCRTSSKTSFDGTVAERVGLAMSNESSPRLCWDGPARIRQSVPSNVWLSGGHSSGADSPKSTYRGRRRLRPRTLLSWREAALPYLWAGHGITKSIFAN